MTLELVTAGESHGPALVAILTGLPAGLVVERDEVDADLRRRQQGYGRSPRQSIETDEVEVLSLLAEGLGQAAIAERLVISPKTVGTHIERILVKLDAHSRAQAVAIAYRLQLVPVPA